jgi:hypothetical protein
MCVDCVLASPRIAQVDPGGEPLSEVVLSQKETLKKTILDEAHTSRYSIHSGSTKDETRDNSLYIRM